MPLRVRQTPTSALIVEHQPAAAQHLSGLVSAMGFDNVWRARSVREALSYCKVTPFDVAIVQLELGEEDGGHLITALRAWPGSVDRIVAVCLDEDRLQQALETKLPADAFLQMPLIASTLQRAIGQSVRTIRPCLDDSDAVLVINDEN